MSSYRIQKFANKYYINIANRLYFIYNMLMILKKLGSEIMLKKLKIRHKILIGILSTTLISGILLANSAFFGVLTVKNNFVNLNNSLKDEIFVKSSDALKNQNLKYIDNISLKQSEKFDAILSDIQLDTSSIAFGMENIYKNKSNFKGINILEPEDTPLGDINDVYSAISKIYNAGDLNAGTQNERLILSNAEFLVEPLYINNYNIDSVYVGTESGLCYNYSVYNNIEKVLPSSQNWYKDAVKAFKAGDKNSVWQSAYIDPKTNKRSIKCSKAFADENGKILGVVCIETFIDTIYDEINSEDIKNFGLVFVVDKENRIILNSDNMDSNQVKSFTDNLKNNYDIFNEINLGDEKYFISSNLINSTGWKFFILCKKDDLIKLTNDLNGQINKLSEESLNNVNLTLAYLLIIFLIIFIVIIFISFLIAKFISKKITDPIEKLSKEAEKIGKGALKRKIKIDSTDEIGDLKNSFNKMTKDLVVYMNKLRRTTKEKEIINNELRIAKKIQKSMLPNNFLELSESKKFDIFATMQPAKMVGGDFYDFFLIDEENLAIVIGDVSGKGIAAALFMVIVKTLIKDQMTNGFGPEKVLELVNKQIVENNDADMFSTVFLGVLNLKTGKFIFSNAGHNKPLIYKKKEGFDWLKTKNGFILGGIENVKYELEEMSFSDGDTIFLYTDGVTEAFNVEDVLFSNERLYSSLNNIDFEDLDAKIVIKKVKDSLEEFTKGKEQSDDITMLALKYFKKDN